ncbi:MAG: glycosyltransferase [Nitrospiraceae bacterium]|nr:MAG: glycosyltransferase [Nitrospiraceae bacterium]
MKINNTGQKLTRIPSVMIALPVYNEEKVLKESVETLVAFLEKHRNYDWKIVIADNNSQDSTGDIGRNLSSRNPLIQYLNIPQKGLGIALKTSWAMADTDFVSYMDIDLSTSLEALILAIDLLVNGADIVTANRLDKRSVLKRCFKREIVSQCYNLLLKIGLGVRFHDAHCGFKTARRSVAQKLLPLIEDNGFFFAAELLFYAERLGYTIVEIPVTWNEDPNTKANIPKDAFDDLCGIFRLKFKNRLKAVDKQI